MNVVVVILSLILYFGGILALTLFAVLFLTKLRKEMLAHYYKSEENQERMIAKLDDDKSAI